MRALLFTVSLLATVPSAEALASLPSISSSAGIAMAVFSMVAALSLVVGVAFFKWIRNRLRRKKKAAAQENVESGQPQISPPQQSDSPPQEIIGNEFNEVLQTWNDQTIDEKDKFIAVMIKGFPVAVTPEMMMAVLQKMLAEEVHAQLWMRMLRFIMMLERDLFRWNQTKQHQEGENTPTRRTHEEFQLFLIAKAEDILHEHGDEAKPNEAAEAGFMRFIAYLFGFVCKYRRITDLMDVLWIEHGLTLTDASRAMVWGYRRWKDDRRRKCLPTATPSNGNHRTFRVLMQELKATAPGSPRIVGTKTQHLLFALGCGYEPDWKEGPLAYMSDRKNPFAKHFVPNDYLWLMMGRDLVMGNAWHWMCVKGLSEHNRMCNRFGQNHKLYHIIVDMVMKYDEDYEEENEECMENFAVRYSAGVRFKIDFAENRNWYERYKGEKQAISLGINTWLMEHPEEFEVKKTEARTVRSNVRVAEVGVAASSNSTSKSTNIRVAEVAASSNSTSKSNSKSTKKKPTGLHF